jgi:GT2 family glycosyltransferase
MIYILILTHNRLAEVQRCFESLTPTLARPDVRLRVLDNSSTDGTVDYVREFVTSVEGIWELSDANLGVAAGRDHLLNNIKHELKPADLVVFLDSDTVIVDNGWLDVLTKAIEPEHIGLVGPGGSFMLPDWSNFTAAIPNAECDVVAGFCQCFKAEVLSAGVQLDLDYGIYWTEDSDFCMQIRAAGYDICCIPTGVYHEAGLSGSAATNEQLQKNLSLFRSKWQGKGLTKTEGGY